MFFLQLFHVVFFYVFFILYYAYGLLLITAWITLVVCVIILANELAFKKVHVDLSFIGRAYHRLGEWIEFGWKFLGNRIRAGLAAPVTKRTRNFLLAIGLLAGIWFIVAYIYDSLGSNYPGIDFVLAAAVITIPFTFFGVTTYTRFMKKRWPKKEELVMTLIVSAYLLTPLMACLPLMSVD